MQRPTSLTIIGWFLIITAAFGLVSLAMMQSNPMAMQMMEQSKLPISTHYVLGIVGAVIALASGYGILKGMNWSRFVYVGWSVLSFVINLYALPMRGMQLIGLAFVAVIAFFLFRPAANAWFKQTSSADA